MKKSASQVLKAVIATIIACIVVFALAVYIFGSQGFWTVGTPVPTPITPTQSGTVGIPISLDITGSVASGTTSGDVTTLPSTETGTNICTMEYAPVCGADGQTYSNACVAGEIAIDHIGACDTLSTQVYDTGSYHLYSNGGVGYSFAMPKYSYYSGAGARDGANHTMMIATTASGVTDFATAPVQVWFYRKIPATPPSDQSVQLQNGTLYIKNNDTTNNPKIMKIVETVKASAK